MLGGEYFPETATINIYQSLFTEKLSLLNGLLAHEYMHSIVEKMSQRELTKIVKSVIGEDNFGVADWASLQNTGSFSEYAANIWKESSDTAFSFKETISEIALMDINEESNAVPENWRKVYIGIMDPKK